MDKMKIHDFEKVFEPLFYNWKIGRQSKESFGEFTTRVVRIPRRLLFEFSGFMKYLLKSLEMELLKIDKFCRDLRNSRS